MGRFEEKARRYFLKQKWTENQVHRLGAFRRKMQRPSHDRMTSFTSFSGAIHGNPRTGGCLLSREMGVNEALHVIGTAF